VVALEALPKDDPRVAVPIYTIGEAARYLRLSDSTLRYWTHPPKGEPLVTTIPARGHQPTVPFIGLAEAFVIAAAKDAGVPDHRIRPGVEGIKRRAGGLEHALASRLVCTDGAEIFLAQLDDDDLDVARTDQRAFRKAVESRLKLIEYDTGDEYARRLRLPEYKADVTIDPRVAGGRPLLRRGVGVRVKDLRDRVAAGDSERSVARDFGIPLGELKEIVRSS
jgi:uncharacterized protein (DUF433 family)